MDSLRIAVADSDPALDDFYRTSLTSLGHGLICLARTGEELLEKCRAASPGLIISEIQLGSPDGIASCRDVCTVSPVPVILVSQPDNPDEALRADEYYFLAHLVKPFTAKALERAIQVARPRFSQFQKVVQENADLRQALEDRKILERAKGIIMKRTGLDELEAFRRLQKLARDHQRKLVDLAKNILIAEEAFAKAGA